MVAFLGRRLLAGLGGWLVASLVIFWIVRLAPGDPARLLLKNPTPAKLAEIRARLALDRPWPAQYAAFVRTFAGRGSLGQSIVTGREVNEDLARTWPATLELAVAAMLLATAAGVGLGVYAARHAGTWRDALASTLSLVGLSVPVYWLGLLALLVFALGLGWLPAGDRVAPGGDGGWLDWLRHLVLPAAVLATVPAAFVARVTRAAMVDTLGRDYIRTARAKGVSERGILYRHALRVVAVPLLTMGAVEFAYLLGGAVLTETVFAWPGIGRYVATAVLARDYPAIQGALLVLVAMVIVVHLAVDLAHYALEPRWRDRGPT